MSAWAKKSKPNFYPRPPGGGRLERPVVLGVAPPISIHALRVEGDIFLSRFFSTAFHFYPRPPGGGRPRLHEVQRPASQNFYPRPPGGGRLDLEEDGIARQLDFYPRPPGGGRHTVTPVRVQRRKFLSTPSGWRATNCFQSAQVIPTFLSTPSGWRATVSLLHYSSPSFYFYPRPPGGGRRK